MARKVNLNDGDFKRFKRNQASLGTQTPLSSTAVERGSTRWLDGSVVFIEGQFTAAGINHLTGVNHLTGPTDVAGNFEIIAGGQFKAGDSVILPSGEADFGGLHIDPDGTMTAGDFELNPDGSAKFGLLTIDADGTITTGETVIDTNGRAEFGSFIIDPASDKLIQAPGGWLVSAGPDSLGLSSSSSSSVQLNSTRAELNYKGTSVVRAEAGLINLNAPQTSINGNLVVTGTLQVSQRVDFANNLYLAANLSMTNPPTTTSAANMFIGGSGAVYKVTSASRFKLDQRETALDPRLLEVPLMDWIDKYAHDNDLETPRVPGVIAEEVHAAGGDLYITRNEDGEIEGVSYDRLALARTQILAHRLSDLEKRMESSHG